MGDETAECLPPALSEKTCGLDFVQGLPEVATLKSRPLPQNLILDHFIDFLQLCMGFVSAICGVLGFSFLISV